MPYTPNSPVTVMPEIPGTWNKKANLLSACAQCGAIRWVDPSRRNRLCKSCGNHKRIVETERSCSRCGEIKSADNFYKATGRNSLRSNCKECTLLPRRRTLIEVYQPGGDGLKACTGCGDRKPTSEFYARGGSRSGFKAKCKACIYLATRMQNREAVKRYTAANSEKVAEMQRQYKFRVKDQTKQKDSVRHKLRRQNRWDSEAPPRPDGCEICGGNESERPGRHALVFDHCHATGKFRGWLCNPCNRALGLVSDNVGTLKSMIIYLEDRSALDKQPN